MAGRKRVKKKKPNPVRKKTTTEIKANFGILSGRQKWENWED